MSLLGALNVGRSALLVSQAAIQTTGNNISNAGNADYTRQVANLQPGFTQQIAGGISVGTGVDLTSIQRQIDEALEGRLRSSLSDNSAATTTSQWLDRVQSVFNELGDQDLSSQMSAFFSSWSALANNPQDSTQRSLVIQNGQNLAGMIKGIQTDMAGLQSDLTTSVKSLVTTADGIAKQIADINNEVARHGGADSSDNALLDQRDALLKQLSGLIDIHTTDGGNGMINVFVGSEPLVTHATSRGLTTSMTAAGDGTMTISVGFKKPAGGAVVAGGQIGALIGLQNGQLRSTMDQLDTLAGSLISQVNQAYAGGQGTSGFTSVTSTNAVTDPAAPLDSAGLSTPPPKTGSVLVSVYNSAGQVVSSGIVSVKLGADGGATPTTLNSLAASFGGIGNINAAVTPEGKLSLSTTSSDLQIKFGIDGQGDSSNVLAALGINTFFSGAGARDIAVNQMVASNSSLLATATQTKTDNTPSDNAVAMKIAALQDAKSEILGGRSLTQAYDDMITQTAVAASTAQNNATAAATVVETLQAQRDNLSGVSMDEEAVNLIKQQRAFQGAAKLVSAVDEMMQTILSMVG